MLTTLADINLSHYAPILILVGMAVTFAAMNIMLTLMLGPQRDGPIKSGTYESGMNPIGTARKRFNVRFYIIAMTFLLFDVEIMFLFPWASTFSNINPNTTDGDVFLFRVLFFLLTTVIAYVYGFRKGVFRFD